MINAPSHWNDLESAVDSKMEIKIQIGGSSGQTYYNEDLAAGDTKITHSLYDSFGIGNAASAEFTTTILDLPAIGDGILSVVPSVRWVSADGQTNTDWVQQGQFWLDSVKINQDHSAAITAYDSLMLAEQLYFPSGEDDPSLWPQAASSVVSYICNALWTTLDSRSSIPSVQIAYPGGKTMRDVLREIATAAHGNWSMTKEGKLRLIPVHGNSSSSLQSITVTDIESLCSEAYVTQVILKDGSTSFSSGSATGHTLEGSFTGADQNMADDLLQACSSVSYQGFSISGGLFSALLELGDPVSTTIGEDTYYYTFDSYSALFEQGCWGDIESPVSTEVNHRIRFTSGQGSQSAAEKAAEQYSLKVVSVAVLPAVQEPNTIYLVQGSAG